MLEVIAAPFGRQSGSIGIFHPGLSLLDSLLHPTRQIGKAVSPLLGLVFHGLQHGGPDSGAVIPLSHRHIHRVKKPGILF